MPSMLDLIKANAVPAAVLRSAAKGALSVPAVEMLEILVYLTGNPVVRDEAMLTLARWDEASAISVLSSPDAPQPVLDYFLDPKNRRDKLMPALLNNPRITSTHAAQPLPLNEEEQEQAHVPGAPSPAGVASGGVEAPSPVLTESALAATPQESHSPDPDSEAAHQAWLQEHAAEIASEEGKEFELTISPDEPEDAAMPEPIPVEALAAQPQPATKPAAVEPEKLSTLTKIARMNVAERVKAAFIGNRDERSILIRDGARVVQNAVLASPKLTEPEVETFAAAKNVQENVLREIARNRRFMKNYGVQRNLVQNPKCPIDISLNLIKNMLVYDLKTLRHSKSVPEVIRKVAANLYREKMSPRDK